MMFLPDTVGERIVSIDCLLVISVIIPWVPIRTVLRR